MKGFHVKNHMLPFFWQHGEDEKTLRNYMRVIQESGCGAVCIESRPHPDFCGPKWWKDMDIILEEAAQRGMQVWILDDSHFPTGYCNGAVEKAPNHLKRYEICHLDFDLDDGQDLYEKDFAVDMKEEELRILAEALPPGKNPDCEILYEGDEIISVTAIHISSAKSEILDLTENIREQKLVWKKKDGRWKIHVVFATRNAGCHRSYMNMMERDSCRILLDTVYEPHWEHYSKYFGNVIAGFFSDEPELGNYRLYHQQNVLGTRQDLPWSNSLLQKMRERAGEDCRKYLPLLWENDYEPKTTAWFRSIYMECMTRLIEENFSYQIGDWCRAHGVMYIGHVIEDNNQHARTGTSLGHFFRGLSGQDMAGIDDIGGQVQPMGQDFKRINKFESLEDGEFYHFSLGKLGASAAASEPLKKGRAMCEIFGNYGWREGTRLEKYLLDHFLVRGINYFVPHAFSAKEYPDPDCPPHFYANGNDPQIRHFGELMRYGNRVSSLISDGVSETHVAILYHAEAEWAGKCMMMQKPARVLCENQIDFHFLSADTISEAILMCENPSLCCEKDGLNWNGYHYKYLLVPYMQYFPEILNDKIKTLTKIGCRVIFIEEWPEALTNGEALEDWTSQCLRLELKDLPKWICEREIREAVFVPESRYLRTYHYRNSKRERFQEVYLFMNEEDKPYEGTLFLNGEKDLAGYDAWRNQEYRVDVKKENGQTRISVSLPAFSSAILYSDPVIEAVEEAKEQEPFFRRNVKESIKLSEFKRSVCRSIQYPEFGDAETITIPENYGETDPVFSGMIRYETEFHIQKENIENAAFLNIEDAGEIVEVWINEKNVGIQIQPPFCYSISEFIKTGKNKLRIEVATTLERERCGGNGALPTGLNGEVTLQFA